MKKLLLIVLLTSASLPSLAADNSLKSATLDLSKLPKKVLLIEPEIYVKELSAGGVAEKVEDWSNQARKNVLDSIDSQISNKQLFNKVSLPKDIAAEEMSKLEEHAALYDVVGFNAFIFGRDQFDAWKHKRKEFDYTLGNGLKDLADKTGADAALFVVGEDYISSGGRKAARIFAALFGVVLPPSPTFLSVGLVDLKTGDLLWMNYGAAADTKDLRKPEDVKAMIDEMMLYYPGRNGTKEK